jgi:NAD-dependent SIR2 family protein deacetylase
MKEDVANFVEDLSQRDFVVFAGAGVPEITKIPTWRDLLTALERRQKIRGVDIKKVDSYLFPEIAQMLFVLFQKEDNAKEYYKIIREEIQPKAASQTNLQQEIILATSRIITTNYDDTFERAFKKLHERKNIEEECTVQTIATLNDVKLKKKNHITYLHGRFDETSIIFKTTDYERNYSCLNGGSESALEKLLRYVYSEEALVFVGFSFDDRYITRTIERIYQDIKDEHVKHEGDPNFRPFLSEIKHYALLEDVPCDDEEIYPLEFEKDLDPKLKKEERIRRAKLLEEKLELMHIKVIGYEYGKHLQLEDWFNGIQRKRDAQRKVWVDKDRQDDTLPDIPRKV